MCGRFSTRRKVVEDVFLAMTGEPFPGEENLNTAPTETAWIVRWKAEGHAALAARWWLTPYWSKTAAPRYATFNAKCENLEKSGTFRDPFRYRRCVVPVGGFYEWTDSPLGRLPYHVEPADGGPLLLGGVWDRWRDRETEEVLYSFAVVTTPVHPKLEWLHDRQPLMLSNADAQVWMDHEMPSDDLGDLFAPRLPGALAAVPVSSYVGNARDKGSRCIEPIGDAVVVEPA